MMLIKKEKTKPKDFGDTLTPKTAFLMLAGLTGYIVQSVDLMVVSTPQGFSDIFVVPEIFEAKVNRTSRFKMSDILLVRDCLILMNGSTPPGRNTDVNTNQLDLFHRLVVAQPQNDLHFASTLAAVGEFLAANGYWLEKYMGGARIVSLAGGGGGGMVRDTE